MEGNYYLAQFDEKNGGECKKTLEKKLLEKGMSEIWDVLIIIKASREDMDMEAYKEYVGNQFDKYDTNGNGSLSKGELKECVNQLPVAGENNEEKIKAFLGQCDDDADGTISKEEFIERLCGWSSIQ